MELSLVADIGGTNTRIALAEGIRILPETVRRFRNADHPGLEPVLGAFLADAGAKVGGACLAVAGPVKDGVARLTNLDWTIDGDALRRATGAGSVAVLNDLQAQGHSLGIIDAVRTIAPGVQQPGPMLVVGVGTGFNAAPVHDERGVRVVPASESGHVNLPVQGEDMELADFLSQIHGFPSVEEALSGRGIENLYEFLTRTRRPSAQIIPAIGTEDAATRTAALFIRLLGAAVGNLALTHLPFGGIYLCGGMARALTPHLDAMGFAAAFRDKGRFGPFMEAFPIHVIEDDYAALTGCAAYIR